ncbi:MAG: endonuclease/exonuclease/phosphatase family protein [Kiritimatiellae bacterium]|nr:endonuclease/exonuclease/phosphatase family protein [Kiritimatiellia bacterium]
MKMIDWLLVMVAVAASVFCVSCRNAEKVQPVPVRVMSYNVRHCCGSDQKVDIDRTVAAILREKPDFAGIQELDCRSPNRSDGVDQPAELGRLTGMHATFAAGIKYPNNGGYGVAVLSKEKPLSVVKLPLPGREPRILLLCEFKDFWFGTTHLSLQATNRVKSVEIIRKVVEECSSNKPVFLTGDWNASPESETLVEFRKFMTVLSKEKSRTFHGFKPYKPGSEHCIDYIAVSSPSASGLDVKDSYVVEDTVTSDHFPVVTAVLQK